MPLGRISLSQYVKIVTCTESVAIGQLPQILLWKNFIWVDQEMIVSHRCVWRDETDGTIHSVYERRMGMGKGSGGFLCDINVNPHGEVSAGGTSVKVIL